ncbi:MAG: thioredoxin family protein [Desulfobacterales bacterium]|nr:thioredoxin family protein [Desulfobacterales bacterium]
MEIKVLGLGCPRCDQLERDLMELLTEMNVDADLEHVRDLEEIRQYGVIGSPAIVVNGDVKVVGVVPPRSKLKALIEQAVNQSISQDQTS